MPRCRQSLRAVRPISRPRSPPPIWCWWSRPATPSATCCAALAPRARAGRWRGVGDQGLRAAAPAVSCMKWRAEVLRPGMPLAVVTGPSFAQGSRAGPADRGHRAFRRRGLRAAASRSCCMRPTFRAYTGTDMIGAELGGAMKNVLAVATGIADGMKLGLNARAGLITRGLNEMLRLAAALGGSPETLMGLAGARRPGADLHRRPLAQPPAGPGAGPRHAAQARPWPRSARWSRAWRPSTRSMRLAAPPWHRTADQRTGPARAARGDHAGRGPAHPAGARAEARVSRTALRRRGQVPCAGRIMAAPAPPNRTLELPCMS